MQDLADIPCEQCGHVGVTQEGMDVFIGCLCKPCFDRLWDAYVKAVTSGMDVTENAGDRLR